MNSDEQVDSAHVDSAHVDPASVDPAQSAGPEQVTEPAVDVDKAFGREAAMQLHRFVDMLAGPGIERGLLGPRERPRLWDRHVLNCAAITGAVPPDSRVADIGSGAGLPGLVLAIIRPDIEVSLIESLQRRVDFLSEAVTELGLTNAVVCHARAEDFSRTLAPRDRYPVVTARAVAPLDRLAGWSLPLLRPGGRLIAIKGERAVTEAAELRGSVLSRGAVAIDVETLGDGAAAATVVIVTKTGLLRP